MRRAQVLALLEQVAAGTLAPSAAVDGMAFDSMESLPFATIDHSRALRQGYPEVIYSPGKTAEQTVAIAERIAARGDGVLVTRADLATREALENRFREARVNEVGRTVHIAPVAGQEGPGVTGSCLIVTAGTSDLPVAEEAAETGSAIGLTIERLTDVGVAGIHRLLSQRDRLTGAGVIIVVAGMDGALPSVVGGLVAVPVIAVPTSVGYGASFGGVAALLTMLNSCASGITVVNIDNGFGAAVAASRILLTK
jgi:pyridinium-3,5-biscarboxylic acid mononucleotide synthase